MLLGTIIAAVGLALPESFQFITEWIAKIIPGNSFNAMTQLCSPTVEDAEPLIGLIVSIAWAIGGSVLAFVLFKTRATLNRG